MHAAMQLATPHSTKRKARILVVDDDPGLLRLLTIRLRAENYDVESAESAAQALASEKYSRDSYLRRTALAYEWLAKSRRSPDGLTGAKADAR